MKNQKEGFLFQWAVVIFIISFIIPLIFGFYGFLARYVNNYNFYLSLHNLFTVDEIISMSRWIPLMIYGFLITSFYISISRVIGKYLKKIPINVISKQQIGLVMVTGMIGAGFGFLMSFCFGWSEGFFSPILPLVNPLSIYIPEIIFGSFIITFVSLLLLFLTGAERSLSQDPPEVANKHIWEYLFTLVLCALIPLEYYIQHIIISNIPPSLILNFLNTLFFVGSIAFLFVLIKFALFQRILRFRDRNNYYSQNYSFFLPLYCIGLIGAVFVFSVLFRTSLVPANFSFTTKSFYYGLYPQIVYSPLAPSLVIAFAHTFPTPKNDINHKIHS